MCNNCSPAQLFCFAPGICSPIPSDGDQGHGKIREPSDPAGWPGRGSEFSLHPAGLDHEHLYRTDHQPALKERVIKRMQKENGSSTGIYGNIDASAVKDTNLIQVKVTSGDPYVATKMTNILTEEYVQYMTEHNQDQMSRSVSFLESQKEKTDKELQEAIKACRNMRRNPGSSSPGTGI